MSTKAIRYLIQLVRTGHAPTEINLDAAEWEVVAIERAARDLLREGPTSLRAGYDTRRDAVATMESIAKDAP